MAEAARNLDLPDLAEDWEAMLQARNENDDESEEDGHEAQIKTVQALLQLAQRSTLCNHPHFGSHFGPRSKS